GDQSTYRLIIKYFSYVEDLLNKQGLLNDNSKNIIKTTIEDVSFMHNCSSADCLKNNPEVLLDFFKNAGAINNLSDNSSLLVTEGIFSDNNQLYVGPIYKSVGMNIDVIKGEVLGVSLFGNFNSGYDYAVRPQPRGSMRIPVLMYHNISPVPTSGSSSYRGLFVSPSMFEQQMAYLKLKGYKTITASEFFDDLKAGKNPKNKTVMITFDDGTRPQYTVAYPILKKYGLKAVYFIIADRLLISPSELKKMSNNGMDIESHSSTHPNLSKIGDVNRLRYELSHSKIKLESITGKKIVSIAYPGCVGGSRVFNLLGTYGYKLAFSCGTTIDHYYSWRPNLSRVHVFSDMYRFKKALSWGL
ncbi:MAG TPA: polysaccharide deacetylase family protein, partial [Candidatus Dojkabacteria bacterium]|nr:polysaccharide deacetylase family protein [Candidatus Dojkabacteria bacterium]